MPGGVFIQYPGRKREVPVRKLIPNALTTVALCSGLAAIHFAMKNDWDRALSAVAVSAIFDMLDGRAARMLRATSPFGTVLDSLSDFLSFGVAPAIILHQWMLGRADALGLAAVMTFALCSALRLARFTAAAQRPKQGEVEVAASSPPAWHAKFFVGMPTPAAAGCVLLPLLIFQSRSFRSEDVVPLSAAKGPMAPEWLVIGLTFLIGGLMISRVPMFSFKKAHIERRWVVPLLVVIGLLVVLASRDPWLTAAILSSAYLLTPPLSFWSYQRYKKRDATAALQLAGGEDRPGMSRAV